jgi:AraC family transcriptional regulator
MRRSRHERVDPPTERTEHSGSIAPSLACNIVEFTPSQIARHESAQWNGITIDHVKIVQRKPHEYGATSACHLLIMAERAERDDGETVVDGLPKSTLRNFTGRLSFIPSGHRFYGWQKPHVLTRVTYIFIDPRGPLLDPELRFAETQFKPRLFFRDLGLWAIGTKLKDQRGSNGVTPQRPYAEALSTLLAHELLRLNNGAREQSNAGAYLRGGLAVRQRNRVADYLEEHLDGNVSLATLAELAQLSRFHFSRAFKQSFGVPPHRYLVRRRLERAKVLLADTDTSVTEIAMAVGYLDTSSFTTAFRKHTGLTPTRYRCSPD